MSKWLVCTVGGSEAPIIETIKKEKPDNILFICSDSSQTQVEKIIAGSGYSKKFKIAVIQAYDLIDQCFIEILEAVDKNIRRGKPTIVADYTGGTKTMSAALAMAAVEKGWELCFVTGARTDLIKVQDGTQHSQRVRTDQILLYSYLNEIDRYFAKYDYQACLALVDNLREVALTPDQLKRLTAIKGILTGLDLWERFQYEAALQKLEPFARQLRAFKSELSKVYRDLENIARRMGGAVNYRISYALVHDVLLNAQRRALAGRYDDATSRLYRATELIAQVNLLNLNPPVNTGDIIIQDSWPAELQQRLENRRNPRGKIQLGLMEAFELWAQLDRNFAPIHDDWKNKLLECIKARNNSFLAHGYEPITREQYDHYFRTLKDFLLAIQESQQQVEKFDESKQWPQKLTELL
ncbi:TIGR02710 family CRISPR-associated CARF protein [Carboxydocella sp. JDF658]|uniref:TIGR02710 family CRISPR-associated CARF protein n=1 Tax=Carboxydocella sp. JDF658 TaxID=1926600 RepID=UPI0009AE248C|nr:TIGR02710 family CRISPR-associated CARF protein [Carboxydocella sp. JDF658]GAW32184.1 CRISPR-associated protein [Carboxydocella sp. JDF658]